MTSITRRPAAVVAAEHGEAPIPLTAAERKVLQDALRRGEDLREQVEATVTSFGRWLLAAVFADDAAAALDEKTKNPVWRELVRRAGGPTLKVNRHMLYVALQLAARDKRITDQSWRGLDAGRKELLLPLAEDQRLRAGARHVTKFNLSHASTRRYVTEVLKAEGTPRPGRLTMPRMVSQVQKLTTRLGSATALKSIAKMRDAIEPKERAKAADEVEKLRAVLADIAKSLRAKR